MSRKFLFILALLLSFTCLMPNGFSDDWQRVYLASFQRSGNHWLRYLIEEATHIATSSVYHDLDPPHLSHLFPWGGYCADHGYEGNCRYPEPNEIVVLKTHFPNSSNATSKHRLYLKTIRLVRHPIDCFYSYYVFFINNKNRRAKFHIPKRTLSLIMTRYVKFQNFWDQKSNVTTFRYEDLYSNPHAVLKQILETIGYQVTEEDIDRAVKKYPPRGGILKHTPHYTQDDLQVLNEGLKDHLEKYGYELPDL